MSKDYAGRVRRRLPLRPHDVLNLAREYDNAPDNDPTCDDLWIEYAEFCIGVQAKLADDYAITLVNDQQPYGHGRELLADLVVAQYQVPAPNACPVHPVWDGQSYAASRTVHDITGHGYGGAYFDLEGEIITLVKQAEFTPKHLVPVVFSDTLMQVSSTLLNHRFAPQKVVLTEHTRLLERCLNL